MDRIAELLAPAGSFETMKAAFCAGADAAYIGGSMFGARAYADNPDEDGILKAIRYAHIHGKKLYLTVNTLLKEEELREKLIPYLKPYYEEGLDAAIVQDPAVFFALQEQFPDLALHASTQMTVTGPLSAKRLEEAGAKRVVLARELSLEEIRRVREACSLEIECFVHGALCYCYSGQCLFSGIVGGRSGNRGRCAQPCRMPYTLYRGKQVLASGNNGYLLSPKDLNTLEILPKMIEAGVYSLKIEGRMKKAEYTAGVVSIYRKYLDRYYEKGAEGYFVRKEDQQALFDLFNRKGFTDGYLTKQNGKDMITLTAPSLRPENTSLNQTIRAAYIDRSLKEKINGNVRIVSGESATIEVSCGSLIRTVSGDPVTEANNQPLQPEQIRRSLEKIRDTEFEWKELKIDTDGHAFYPAGKLNELRRRAVEALEEAICSPYYRKKESEWKRAEYRECGRPEEGRRSEKDGRSEKSGSYPAPEVFSASAESQKQLELLLKESWIGRIYLDIHIGSIETWITCAEAVRKAGKEVYLILPKIVRLRSLKKLDQLFEAMPDHLLDGVLAGNIEGLEYLTDRKKQGKDRYSYSIMGDHTLYAYSAEAQTAWKELGTQEETLPVELCRKEIIKRGTEGLEVIIYGYLPMMVSAQCLHRSSHGCIQKTEDMVLKDRMGNLLPVRNYCDDCCNVIYNSSPLSLIDSIGSFPAKKVRLMFTIESGEETAAVLALYRKAALKGDYGENLKNFTRGHLKRGVE